MKKRVIMFLFLFVFFGISFISASSASLIENSTWQGNLTGSNFHNGAVLGDIDGDGDLDMISIGCTTGSISCTAADKSHVWINNGSGFEENLTWEQNLSDTRPGAIAMGDIDNDGDLDLVLSGVGTRIYINNGTSFQENLTWQDGLLSGTTISDSSSIALGDIDNDGDLDLIFPSMDPSSLIVWINNGTSFTNSTAWGQEIIDESKETIGLIDLDNDFDLDINIMGLDSAKSYINNGTSFEADANWNTFSADEGSIVWGDIDNDGDMDSVISRVSLGCAGGNVIFQNNGSTLLSNSSWDLDMSGFQFGSVAFGDYDNNGYLDLANFGICAGISRVQILSNNGSIFAQDINAQANITGQRHSSSLWGDIDNDGDLDLIVIKSQKVYINNITTANTEPTPPISFSSSYNNREIKLGWKNGSDNETTSMGLYYNLMVGNSSNNNHSIISGIYGGQGDASNGGGTAFGYFGNMMQRKNFTLKVDRLEESTNYTWYVQTIDTGLKAGNWSVMQSFTTPDDMESPNISLNSPVNNFNSSSYTVTFNATVFDNINLTNVSLWGNWTGSFIVNQSNASGENNTDYIFTVDLTGYDDGYYIWMIEARDNNTNVINSSIRTFTLDTKGPAIAIVSPNNNTNTTNTELDVNFTVSDAFIGLESCWYSNDTNTINRSLVCGQNLTNITWAEGQHNVTIYANDSSGNENSSRISFTIDTINPDISIINPTVNNSNTTNTGLDINFTISDSNLASCWYSNDTYNINRSLICGTNLTNITWSEGSHNITVYVNDSVGNENSSTISFRIDTKGPAISIVSPNNNSNSSNDNLDINFTFNDLGVGVESCWYSNDTNNINRSLVCGQNLTNITWSEQQHNVTIWINDSLGNENKTIVSFTINTTDTTAPNVNLIDPSNSTSYTSNSQSVAFSYNVTEKNIVNNCSLIINSQINLTNFSISKSVTQNFTQTFTPAVYNWNVNCTDENNNIGNSSIRSFTVTAPADDAGGGGGGGGGGGSSSTTTPKPVIFDIDFSNMSIGDFKTLGVKQGDVKTFTFNRLTKHFITIITLTGNSATLLITSDPITVQILLNGENRIDINEDGIDDLKIKFISIAGVNGKLSFTKLEGADIVGQEELEEAARKEALFDVKVSVLDKFKKVFPGEEVSAEIEVFNVNNIGQVDVIIDYYINDKNISGNVSKDDTIILAQSSDTLAVEAVTSFVRSLIVPENVKPGNYYFNVDVIFKNFTTSSNAEFRVKGKLNFLQDRFKLTIIIIVIIIIILGIFLYFYLRKIKSKEDKLEKVIRKINSINKIKKTTKSSFKIKGRKNGRSKNR